MQSLVEYESSDEEHENNTSSHAARYAEKDRDAPAHSHREEPENGIDSGKSVSDSTGLSSKPHATSTATDDSKKVHQDRIVGPTMPDNSAGYNEDSGEVSQPQSPHTTTRSLVRDLTLPPVPNLDIPPSPPGSPPASTSSKFANFMELKRKGVHFNEKLAKSSALKNPSLLQKLTGFAGIDDQGQYSTTLPVEVWNIKGFPRFAYKDELAKSQQEVLKRKEEEKGKGQRDSLDFVPAASSTSGNSTRASTPGSRMEARRPAKSTAERVMAGLQADHTAPVHQRDIVRDYQKIRRSRSRSPERRRRSRSR